MLLLAGMMTATRALRAQQKAKPVIGFLSSRTPGDAAAVVVAFHQGLAETGYVEGQNLAIEYHWAEGRYDQLPALAADLVGRKVDLIVASGGPPSVRAAKSVTYRSSSPPSATRFGPVWSPASPGRAAISRARASYQPS
jgi:putative ABC transport system substrate-binding protein